MFGAGLLPGGGPMRRLPRLIAEACAGCCSGCWTMFRADLADCYGYGQSILLPYSDLSMRLSMRWKTDRIVRQGGVADTKRLVDVQACRPTRNLT